jgi:hypothetical protein
MGSLNSKSFKAHMKALLISVLLVLFTGSINAGSGSVSNDSQFEKYFNEITYVDVFLDAENKLDHLNVKLFIESGSPAVAFLVKKISNTSSSNVKSIGLLQKPKKGELALILLMRIYKIPDENWPFPPGYDIKASALFPPSDLKGGPLLINEYFRAKQGPKKLRSIWETYINNNSQPGIQQRR